jgi:hypothetical protein
MTLTETRDIKYLRNITRDEYIVWDWINATAYGDTELTMLRGYPRTPDQAAKAAQDWDIWNRSIRRESLRSK